VVQCFGGLKEGWGVQSHLMEAVEGFINSGAEPAEKMIRDMVECELAFINTDHPSFLGGNRAIGMVMERRSNLTEETGEEEAPKAGQSMSMAGDLAIARHSRAAGLPLPPGGTPADRFGVLKRFYTHVLACTLWGRAY